MSDQFFEGEAVTGAGDLETKFGERLDRPDLHAAGAAKQVKGKALRTLGELQGKAADVSEHVSAAAAAASERAKAAYGEATDRFEKVAERVDPFVRGQPYVAIGLAAAFGLLMGLLLAGRGSKIVYLKSHRD